MQVGHCLAALRPVVDHQPEALTQAQVAGDVACGEQEVSEDRLIGIRSLANPGNEPLRNDQQMDRCLGVDVADHDALRILVLNGGRDLPVDDLLEDGLGHGSGITDGTG